MLIFLYMNHPDHRVLKVPCKTALLSLKVSQKFPGFLLEIFTEKQERLHCWLG